VPVTVVRGIDQALAPQSPVSPLQHQRRIRTLHPVQA
jgi:hypothetical protein